MSLYVLPVLFTLALWWGSTGVILKLVKLPRSSFPLSMLGMTAVLLIGIQGLWSSRDDVSVAGGYLAFASGMAVWAWIETSFLLGYVTGPRRQPCETGCSGGRHFLHSVAAILWHEVAIAVGMVLVGWLTRGGANDVGWATFMVLWVMRLSAKLNLFLGVPNRGEQFLPPHLQYLKSFFGAQRINFLFPLSITAITALAGWLLAMLAGRPGDFMATSYTLLLTLVLLALVEHWFMVLPWDSERLWQWHQDSAERDPISSPKKHAVPTSLEASAASR
jgi:putative photosynthetic complex assembly protein 2